MPVLAVHLRPEAPLVGKDHHDVLSGTLLEQRGGELGDALLRRTLAHPVEDLAGCHPSGR